ncbi:hypothetical protein LCGC14_2913800 [marine sediment metagenome]|uniref:Uncharacterized protein n=1 Tax=marine sediment metagenome TaxID=412755 RepID=A0A0F8ZYJ5_9ZZZZ
MMPRPWPAPLTIFSVDGTLSWDGGDVEETVALELADKFTDDLRTHVTEHLSALMADLDARFPREGEQQG